MGQLDRYECIECGRGLWSTVPLFNCVNCNTEGAMERVEMKPSDQPQRPLHPMQAMGSQQWYKDQQKRERDRKKSEAKKRQQEQKRVARQYNEARNRQMQNAIDREIEKEFPEFMRRLEERLAAESIMDEIDASRSE